MLTKREKWGHAVGEFGNNLVYNLFTTYLMLFYTDVMELPSSFTGVLFLLSRILVAVSDPVVGVLSDRTHSRWGRYRIWLLLASPVVAVFLVLSFISPSESLAVKYVWSFVTFLVLGVAFTATDVPFWTLPSVMTASPEERASVFSLSGSVGIVSGGIASFIVPLIVSHSPSYRAGYILTSVVFAFVLVICYYWCVFSVHERVEKKENRTSLSASVRAIMKNGPLMTAALGGLIVNIGFFLRNSAVSYYGIYVLGSYGYVSLLTMMILFGRLLGSFLVPSLSKRLGNRCALLSVLLYGTLVSAVFTFTGFSSPAAVSLMILLSSLSNGAFFVLFSSIISDTIDYGEYRFRVRNDGMITSFRTFVTKIGSAVAGASLAFYLSLSGYRANAAQSPATKRMLHMLLSAVPASLYALGAIVFLFYPLGKKRLGEIEKELVKLRSSASEGN